MSRRNRPTLAVEALEGRALPSASPLPVLLVIADRQDFSPPSPAVTRAAAATPPADYSAVVFVGGWGSSM